MDACLAMSSSALIPAKSLYDNLPGTSPILLIAWRSLGLFAKDSISLAKSFNDLIVFWSSKSVLIRLILTLLKLLVWRLSVLSLIQSLFLAAFLFILAIKLSACVLNLPETSILAASGVPGAGAGAGALSWTDTFAAEVVCSLFPVAFAVLGWTSSASNMTSIPFCRICSMRVY